METGNVVREHTSKSEGGLPENSRFERKMQKNMVTRGVGRGCSSWFRGLARQPHTDACRARFKDAMKEDARVKNSEIRKAEFAEKLELKRIRKEEKKKQKENKGSEAGADQDRGGAVEGSGVGSSDGDKAVETESEKAL